MPCLSSKKIFTLVTFLFIFFLKPAPVAAVCNFYSSMSPTTKDITWSNTCTVNGTEGIDETSSETSVTNSATLTITGGSITINSGGRLLTGSIILTGGNIALQQGGIITTGVGAYIADSDADGWPGSFTLFNTTASGRRRLSLMRSYSSVDCNDSVFSTGNSCFMNATGGVVTFSGNYKIHTFTSSGTLSVSSLGNGSIQYLIVAGGGGGGLGTGGAAGRGGGGGGAGGMLTGTAILSGTGNYPVSVGGGGNGSCISAPGVTGGNSAWGGLTSVGGGGGGTGQGNNGVAGGSGGGSPGNNSICTSGGAGTAGQGNRGGNVCDLGVHRSGGGGGGRGSAGSDTTINAGVGLASSISGISVVYATGGVGGTWQSTENCGTPGTPGTNGLGNGGNAGQSTTGCSICGGSGGSGIVILRYQYQ